MATQLVNLKDGSNILIPKVFGGIDVSNIIEEYHNAYDSGKSLFKSYNEDVILIFDYVYFIYDSTEIQIDNIPLPLDVQSNGSEYIYSIFIPLKKGQIFSITGNDCAWFRVYGIKY